MSLADGVRISGKLVWKVDWPMRWAHENVSSSRRARTITRRRAASPSGARWSASVFGGEAPRPPMYSFVDASPGSAARCRARRAVRHPGGGADVLEPAIVRWPYVQRTPNQSFGIDLLGEGHAEARTTTGTSSSHRDRRRTRRADRARRTTGIDACRPRPGTSTARRGRVSFRLLALAADITTGQPRADGADRRRPPRRAAAGDRQLLAELEPRLTLRDRTTRPRSCRPSSARRCAGDLRRRDAGGARRAHAARRASCCRATSREHWSLDGLTTLVYGVPKRHARAAARRAPDARAQGGPAGSSSRRSTGCWWHGDRAAAADADAVDRPGRTLRPARRGRAGVELLSPSRPPPSSTASHGAERGLANPTACSRSSASSSCAATSSTWPWPS